MSEQQHKSSTDIPAPIERLASLRSLDPVALKWRNLIERRRAHFVDLYLTGRWKRYFSEEQFLATFRETMSIADRWTEIAPKPDDKNLAKVELPNLAASPAEAAVPLRDKSPK
jgi:uncharacterized repeat protein (TIGR03809 family)